MPHSSFKSWKAAMIARIPSWGPKAGRQYRKSLDMERQEAETYFSKKVFRAVVKAVGPVDNLWKDRARTSVRRAIVKCVLGMEPSVPHTTRSAAASYVANAMTQYSDLADHFVDERDPAEPVTFGHLSQLRKIEKGLSSLHPPGVDQRLLKYARGLAASDAMSAGSVVAGMVERLDKLSALCPEPPESSSPAPADEGPADIDSDTTSDDSGGVGGDEDDEGEKATNSGQPIPQTTGSAAQASTSGLTPSMLSLALPSPHSSTTCPR
eukprot:m51a1_g4766 hypothetical protein (266) ;mRNA; f:12243-13085